MTANGCNDDLDDNCCGDGMAAETMATVTRAAGAQAGAVT
jgi:hypothetical protein